MLCIVGHISKHIREEWMSFMGMFLQTQHWHIPWTKVLVLFLLILHHFCPWASLLNSQTVIPALLLSSYRAVASPLQRDGTEPDPREECKQHDLRACNWSIYLASFSSSVQALLTFDLKEVLVISNDWKLESLLYKSHKKIFWSVVGYNSSRAVRRWCCTAGHNKH